MAAEGEGTPPTDVADVACSQEKDAVGEVCITVLAEDELGRVFEWTRSLPSGGPLSDLARNWAVEHSVPDSAVGFDFLDPEAGERREIDLGRSPLELGWPSQVRLFAFPLDMEFAEKAPRQERSRSRKGRRKASASTAPPAAAAAATPAVPPAPDAAAAASTRRGRSAVVRGVSNDDDHPAMHEAIAYLQENPKQLGSRGWERYEGYKGAKTPAEALALGSAAGDLKHDWKKGFYHRTQGEKENEQ